MYKIGTTTVDLGDNRPITIETGKYAQLANAAVMVRQGDTVVLVTVCSSKPREGCDFFPLQVAYREKYSASGSFPGGYIKRENRPGEHEVLISRMTDRPIRSLFPKGFFHDVQIQAIALAYDGVNEPDMLAMLGASAVCALSDLPFGGPTGSLRVGMIGEDFIANPTAQQMKESKLELVYSGLVGKTIMIEGESDELSEEQLLEGLKFADKQVAIMVDAQNKLVAEFGKPTKDYALLVPCVDLVAEISTLATEKLNAPCLIVDRTERGDALNIVKAEVVETLVAKYGEEKEDAIKEAFEAVVVKNIRRLILEEGKRADGRGVADLRPLYAEVASLPRVHGSSTFARGETQGLVTVTLGSSSDTQTVDGIRGAHEKKFYLHYNFPNFSVGECGRMMGPGNREIGHGNLAERSVAKMMPADYPYTVRVISEIMASNGSTSMASICGASLALFDAGVPLKKSVAGISVGLVQEGDKYVMITDILGSEDHYGDMDFKVAGTRDGITGFQLDLKIPGVSLDIMYEAMMRDKVARMAILDKMDATMAAPRESISNTAPQMHIMQINPEKIGALIGPGGKNIKSIVEETGAKVDVDDTGKVSLFCSNGESLKAAIARVEGACFEPEVGKIYRGVVERVEAYGCFVGFHGTSGLLHISELADCRVEKVEDICSLNDKVTVKVVDIDDRGRVRLSRKAALADMD